MLFILLYLLTSVVAAYASISVVNPIDNQLPLIARFNEPFSWAFSPETFESSAGAAISYTTTPLPGWLSFDAATRSFSGTPSAQDEGNPEITVSAHDATSSAPSRFTLCVTAFPPLTVNLPLVSQFYDSNPSLSSVFLLSPNSALATDNPTLRVPPKWSFSVGLEGNTFKASNDLYYDALLADGSALPDWLQFNKNSITFDGVAPSSPQSVELALHGSDQNGYTSSALPFSLVVAAHELSQSSSSLPTINITASTTFSVSLTSPNDFSGVLVDGNAIQLSDIASLIIDTSQYGSWLKYDEGSMTLSGQPPSDLHASTQGPMLPVTLTASFNQSIHTNVSLAVVPSYFSESTLPPITSDPREQLHFNLVQYFTNATRDDVNLTAAFDATQANSYLNFDSKTAQLTGTIPDDLSATGADVTSDNPHISVTFTAYSYVTHSTSHASLEIVFSPSENDKKGGGHSHLVPLSAAARKRLALGLGIAFGILGGLILFGVLLAAFRRYARVADTALVGEEGGRAWTAAEKKWYGIGVMGGKRGQGIEGGRGYGWTEQRDESESPEKLRIPSRIADGNPFDPGLSVPPQGRRSPYAALGLGLRRVSNRTASDPSQVSSRGVMSKAEFMGKIKETVRNVSDRYKRGISNVARPVIGKPSLVTTNLKDGRSRPEGLPFDRQGAFSGSTFQVDSILHTEVNPFDDGGTGKYADSALTASPSNSTGERSIPRRRADFAPPKSPRGPREPATAHLRRRSTDSADSLISNSSVITHGARAIVKTATRATSVRSSRSVKSVSGVSQLDVVGPDSGGRPRLVPFTSATRVPIPSVSSTHLAGGPNVPDSGGSQRSGAKRVTSQTATVFKNASLKEDRKKGSVDELAIGMHYVRALGGDEQQPRSARNSVQKSPSTPTISTNLRSTPRSSFSSLESSHHGHGASGSRNAVSRVLVRANEKFKFKVPIISKDGAQVPVEARMVSGDPLPNFLHVDLKNGRKQKGAVEFYGIPSAGDLGEMNVGIYGEGDRRLGRVVVEVVGRS